MEIYKKITWKIKNDNIDVKHILGKEKLRLINKGLSYFQENKYDIGIELLDMNNLKDFYENIYKHHISEKINPKEDDLMERYKERLSSEEKIYFGYIRKDGELLAGGIFLEKFREGEGSLAMLGFRAYKDIKIEKIGLGYYIEYLFYKWAIEKKYDRLSRGLDRNAYGIMGANIGLAIHKIQHNFLPYVGKLDEKIEIDETKIDKECIIFTEEDEQKRLKKAYIWTKMSPEDQEKTYNIIKKRGLEVEIKNI